MEKVTVLMPVYNVGPYVTEAIRSVLAQSYTNFVLLVMDDCSTDDTAEKVKAIEDERIRYVKNPVNLGLAENLNKGLSLIETEYVARFDGDDIAEPEWLEENMKMMESHPEIGICSSGYEWVGTRHGEVFYPERNEDSMCQMLFGCTVIVPVFRKSVFEANHIRYQTSAFPAEDYRVWADCYRVTTVYNIQKVLFHYRMHPSQISTSKRQKQIEKTQEVQRVMLEWLNPDMAEEDIRFFLDVFAPARMSSLQDIPIWQTFAEKMMAYNSFNHYDAEALRRRLQSQINIAASNAALDECFGERYTFSGWLRWRASGYAMPFFSKQNGKMLLKSLLKQKR